MMNIRLTKIRNILVKDLKILIFKVIFQYLKLVESFQKFEELNGLEISTVGGFKVLDQYNPNITRAEKCILDLDESDMNACGYNKSKGTNHFAVRPKPIWCTIWLWPQHWKIGKKFKYIYSIFSWNNNWTKWYNIGRGLWRSKSKSNQSLIPWKHTNPVSETIGYSSFTLITPKNWILKVRKFTNFKKHFKETFQFKFNLSPNLNPNLNPATLSK